MNTSPTLSQIEACKCQPEGPLVQALAKSAALSSNERKEIVRVAADLVRTIRADGNPGLMETFLAEYGLSSDEGIALMCLAEALLRVPDARTIEDLIEDKIVPADWGRHLGQSASSLVNASTWALLLTGKILDDKQPSIAAQMRSAIKRLGEPVIRKAVARAMKEMGQQFILAETIENSVDRAEKAEKQGYTYSYDMLGEAALTAGDAEKYRQRYVDAIAVIAKRCNGPDIHSNPGISIKLSALHPRYEVAQSERVMAELVPVVIDLCRRAAAGGMGLNVDAEEADRLGLSLQVIQAVLAEPELQDWKGFGVVVQAYSRRAGMVLDWLYEAAGKADRNITVRLVKGAYWDTEIKHAQVEGLADFPVFTRKSHSDISYIANARKLLGMTDRIYPQFATHNAHTVCAILHLAQDGPHDTFEFQRLHGMGERLHDIVHKNNQTRCRIYAPVGAHRDLLAYLVRRLLENGANSSFVHQIVNNDVPPEQVVACPFEQMSKTNDLVIPTGPQLFQPERRNSAGWDLHSPVDLDNIETARKGYSSGPVAPILAGKFQGSSSRLLYNPASGETVGQVTDGNKTDVAAALAKATPWTDSTAKRASILESAADLYEADFGPIFALLAQEAGKTPLDAVGELREAVDFLRYYAAQARSVTLSPRGIFACISPWNFPLAIFTGQIAAALSVGNAVVAKPAEQTPLIAAHAVKLMHRAGVPVSALQLLPGSGSVVGAALTGDPRIDGVAFTGSTDTALRIRRAMAHSGNPTAPLIAETGGINAMIVDSTALPEQAVRDIVASAFQSAGQRCSALRCLYLQEDVADEMVKMLTGAMDQLRVGDPWLLSTDVGPVIDSAAQTEIQSYVDQAESQGRLIKQLPVPDRGTFVGPALIRVDGIGDIEKEIFGPVLHVTTYRAEDIETVIAAINDTGYGLTFGMHSRIDSRVQQVADGVHAGNLYINRNQIGAVVGSQPFGGEGLSGTGPKAGGPNYLKRFVRHSAPGQGAQNWQRPQDRAVLQARIDAIDCGDLVGETEMPGPTGESNRLRQYRRRPLICLGPGPEMARMQVELITRQNGCAVAATGSVSPQDLELLKDYAGVVWWGDTTTAAELARSLAGRKGEILPLICDQPDPGHLFHERLLCVDTTAAGGNTALLGMAG